MVVKSWVVFMLFWFKEKKSRQKYNYPGEPKCVFRSIQDQTSLMFVFMYVCIIYPCLPLKSVTKNFNFKILLVDFLRMMGNYFKMVRCRRFSITLIINLNVYCNRLVWWLVQQKWWFIYVNWNNIFIRW